MKKILRNMVLAFVLIASQVGQAAWTPLQLSISHQVQMVPRNVPVYGLRLCFPYGMNDEVDGLDLSFFKTPARGLALQSGLICMQEPESGGLSVAGLVNFGDFHGVQLGGLMASSDPMLSDSNPIDCAQISSIFNRTRNLTGLQLSGLVNVGSDINGAQIAGYSTVAEAVSGVQLAGLSCGASFFRGLQIGGCVAWADTLHGMQVAGLANIAQNMASGGCQIGAVNVTKSGRGIQVGAFNFAETQNGMQIGILNINLHGPIPVFPGINFGWGNEISDGTAGAKPFEKNKFLVGSIAAPIVAAAIAGIGLLIAVDVHNTGDSITHFFDHAF